MAGSEQTAAQCRRLLAGRSWQRGGGNLVGIMGWKETSEAILNRDTNKGPLGGFVNGRYDTVNRFI